jgi:hypothetical protein
MAHVLRQVRVRGELEWLAAAQLMRRFVGYIWVRRILEGWIGASQGKEVYRNGSNRQVISDLTETSVVWGPKSIDGLTTSGVYIT